MSRYNNRPRKSWGEIIADLIVSILQTLLAGWALMMAVGVVHHEWIPQVPTIGYHWALWLAILLGVVFRASQPSEEKE